MAPYFVLATLLALVAAVVLAWPLRGSRPLFAGLVIAIPMMALSLYQLVGTPAGLDPAQRRAPETLEQAITQLQADLERDPRQVEGWRLLGRALQQQERYAEARDAFARAARLDPEDLGLQTEYAESRSRADAQRRFDDEAIGILERVLQLDAAQHRARLFLGIGYRQHGRSAEAAATWEPLLPTLGGEAATGLRLQINEARVHAGLAPDPGADGLHAFEAQTIALIAHDAMKPRMLDFVAAHFDLLSRFAGRVATGTTGQRLNELAWRHGWPSDQVWTQRFQSGPLGGDAQIADLVLDGRCQRAVFFEDPHVARQHEADIQLLERAVTTVTDTVACLTSPRVADRWAQAAERRAVQRAA